MKTIEERADTIADRYVDELHQKIARSSAIESATEQRAIDDEYISKITKAWMDKYDELVNLADKREKVLIDKTCEWIKSHCEIVGGSITNWENDFRKMMKG